MTEFAKTSGPNNEGTRHPQSASHDLLIVHEQQSAIKDDTEIEYSSELVVDRDSGNRDNMKPELEAS